MFIGNQEHTGFFGGGAGRGREKKKQNHAQLDQEKAKKGRIQIKTSYKQGTFRSLIHFEFIFVYGVRECSNFILLHVAVQFSQRHLLKRLSFLHCISLPPLS